MLFSRTSHRREGSSGHFRRSALCLTVFALLTFQPHGARGPGVARKTSPVTALEFLAEASRLAFLHNWQTAAPLFRQADAYSGEVGHRFRWMWGSVGAKRRWLRS